MFYFLLQVCQWQICCLWWTPLTMMVLQPDVLAFTNVSLGWESVTSCSLMSWLSPMFLGDGSRWHLAAWCSGFHWCSQWYPGSPKVQTNSALQLFLGEWSWWHLAAWCPSFHRCFFGMERWHLAAWCPGFDWCFLGMGVKDIFQPDVLAFTDVSWEMELVISCNLMLLFLPMFFRGMESVVSWRPKVQTNSSFTVFSWGQSRSWSCWRSWSWSWSWSCWGTAMLSLISPSSPPCCGTSPAKQINRTKDVSKRSSVQLYPLIDWTKDVGKCSCVRLYPLIDRTKDISKCSRMQLYLLFSLFISPRQLHCLLKNLKQNDC